MNTVRPVVGLPNLAWLRSFEAAARTSSFAAAAIELNLTSGAISYQIRALEEHLGFALFERLPRGVRLTAMGVAYLPPVRKAFEELADSTVGLFGGSERVQVSLNAPVSFATLWLTPKLPAFAAAHPHIDVRVSSVIWDDPTPNEATDLEIRYGTGHWHGYRADHLLNQTLMAVCSPTLLQAVQAGRQVDTLLDEHLIRIRGYEDHGSRARQSSRSHPQVSHRGVSRGFSVDTTLAALELAASGTGCALAHRVFLSAYLSTGRLVQALNQEFVDDSSYFVVTPERPQRARREVQVFREWLLAQAAEQ